MGFGDYAHSFERVYHPDDAHGYETRPLVPRLLMPLMLRLFIRKAVEKDFDAVKAFCESESARRPKDANNAWPLRPVTLAQSLAQAPGSVARDRSSA
jgi:hypothetical protein